VTDSEDAFEKLEEKLLRAAEIFKQTQSERRAREKELEELDADLKERTKRIDALERELQALRREREDVRIRIQKLVRHLDVLTKRESTD